MPGTIAQYLRFPARYFRHSQAEPGRRTGPGLDSIIGQGERAIKARRSWRGPGPAHTSPSHAGGLRVSWSDLVTGG
jgi:hypothetical protein